MRKLALAAGCACLLASQGVNALGLGKIETHSHLNQPLAAEIPVISATRDELDTLAVDLAGDSAYRAAGIARSRLLDELTLSLEGMAAGEPVIAISSERAIAEPFLNLLVQAQWSAGGLVREYSVLLDPAPAEGSAAAITPDAADSRSEASSQTGAARQSGQYGPVTARDTLWGIASDNRPVGTTVQQMAVAIFRANPDGFLNGDIDRMRKGATLDLPGEAEVRELTPRTALAEFRELRGGAEEKPAPASAETSPADATAGQSEQAQVRLVAPESEEGDGSSTPASEPGEEVQSAQPEGETGDRTEAEMEALRSELASLREVAQERARENDRLQDQLASLQEQLEETLETAELRSEELAQIRESLRQAREAQPAPASGVNGGWQGLLSNPLVTGGLAGVVVLLLALLALRRRGPAKSDAGSADLVADARPPSEPAMPTEGTGDREAEKSRMASFEPASEASATEVLEEADVMLAYGLKDRAAELLEDAIESHPDNVDYRAKLLEVYRLAEDRPAFDRHLAGLRAIPGAQASEAWSRLQERAGDWMTSEDADAVPEIEPAGEQPPAQPEAEFPSELAEKPSEEAFPEALLQETGEGKGAPEEKASATEPVSEPTPLEFDISEMGEPASTEEKKDAELGLDLHTGEAEQEPTKKETASAPESDPEAELGLTLEDFQPPGETESPEAPAEGVATESEAEPESQPEAEPEMKEYDFADLALETPGAPETTLAEPDAGEGGAESEPESKPEKEAEEPANEPLEMPDFAGGDEPSAEPEEPTATEGSDALELPSVGDLEAPAAEAPEEPEPAPEPDELQSAEETAPAAAETEKLGDDELGTKLDLARAFMDMGDNEGARATLDEVMESGDARHQDEAKELLARLADQ